ncbi:MAG: GNAT family N-acetyltransferase [Roseiflexaceae bacterium]
MCSSAIAQDIEGIEQAVYADTLTAAPAGLPHPPPALMQEGGALWGVVAGIQHQGWSGFFNQVLGVGLTPPATETLLDSILASHRDAHIPFLVALSPHAQPAQLSQWLIHRKLVQQHWLAQCYRTVEPTPAPTTPFDIQRIDAADAMRYVQIAAIGLPPLLHPWIAALVGRAGWRHYLAFRDGIAVAGAAMFIQNGVGYLTWTGTQPAARGQGAQTALIAHRLHEAGAGKCRAVVAETFEGSQDHPAVSCRNLVRAGFHVAYYKALYEG